jgi:hypothetical protein
MSAEDTIVQVRDRSGTGWTDYARTTRAAALAAVEAGRLPGHAEPEELRAVDWISKEEIEVATRTAHAQAQAKVEETKARATANGVPAEVAEELRSKRAEGVSLAELRKLHPELTAAQIKAAVEAPAPTLDLPKLDAIITGPTVEEPKRKPRRAKAPVETKRVKPTKPVRSKFGSKVEFDKAMKEYRTALARFEAEGKVPEVTEATVTDGGKAKTIRVQATGQKKAKVAAEDDGVDWNSKAVANRIVKMKQDGRTIKEIAEAMELPAVHRSWLRVSNVWRREADARGLSRPRHSAETVAKRIATRRAS